jgi:hypothetical protein
LNFEPQTTNNKQQTTNNKQQTTNNKQQTTNSMNNTIKNLKLTFSRLFIFAVAMGFLEGIVVVYVRQLYYPKGFDFPLTMLSPEMLSVEWLREITTIVMLAAIAWIAGKNLSQRGSFFLFVFGVWDIFYYVALKLILGWPSSLLTWDILFLIPVPWLGPVLAPVLISLVMIVVSFLFTFLPEKGFPIVIKPLDWILLIAGNGIMFFTFIRDYLNLITESGIIAGNENPEEKAQFWKDITSFVPVHYNWMLYIAGILLVITGLFLVIRRSVQNKII